MENKDEIGLKYEYFFLAEKHIFYIAVLLITLVGVLLIVYFPSDPQMAQGLLTGLIAWISAVVGFYFGSKPISDVVSRLENKEKQIAYVSQESNELLDLSQHFQELYEKTIEIAENLNSGKE